MPSEYKDYFLEYCCECGESTGDAGGEDSHYTEDDNGPFCWECFPEKDL